MRFKKNEIINVHNIGITVQLSICIPPQFRKDRGTVWMQGHVISYKYKLQLPTIARYTVIAIFAIAASAKALSISQLQASLLVSLLVPVNLTKFFAVLVIAVELTIAAGLCLLPKLRLQIL